MSPSIYARAAYAIAKWWNQKRLLQKAHDEQFELASRAIEQLHETLRLLEKNRAQIDNALPLMGNALKELLEDGPLTLEGLTEEQLRAMNMRVLRAGAQLTQAYSVLTGSAAPPKEKEQPSSEPTKSMNDWLREPDETAPLSEEELEDINRELEVAEMSETEPDETELSSGAPAGDDSEPSR